MNEIANYGQHKIRMLWPDIAKGICIISVMAGHMRSPLINKTVYLWHLPVFFILSGYFLKKEKDDYFLKKKAKRLLKPYYFTCLLICIIGFIRALVEKEDAMYILASWIFASIYAAGDTWRSPILIYGIGAIWFLWALFFADIIVNHFTEKRFGFILVLMIAFLGWASSEYGVLWLPLSVQAGFLCSLYVYIGYEFRRLNFNPSDPGIVIFIVSLLISLIGIYHFKGFWLVHDFMGNGWMDFFVSIFASIVIMTIAQCISKGPLLIQKIFVFFGENSLMILCLHLLELDVIRIRDFLDNYFVNKNYMINEPIKLLLLFVIRIAFVLIATVIFKRIEFIRNIFGYKNQTSKLA